MIGLTVADRLTYGKYPTYCLTNFSKRMLISLVISRKKNTEQPLIKHLLSQGIPFPDEKTGSELQFHFPPSHKDDPDQHFFPRVSTISNSKRKDYISKTMETQVVIIGSKPEEKDPYQTA